VDDIRFPIDPVHVMLFARAVGDDNPLYLDATTAHPNQMGAVAPPTFTEALQQFIPDYTWRPRPGQPWPAPSSQPEDPAMDSSSVVLHAEQRFTYVRPVRTGEVLTARRRPGQNWQKISRTRGVLEFREIITDFFDRDDTLVISSVAVEVEMSPAP
jgi:acyl dehydratase